MNGTRKRAFATFDELMRWGKAELAAGGPLPDEPPWGPFRVLERSGSVIVTSPVRAPEAIAVPQSVTVEISIARGDPVVMELGYNSTRQGYVVRAVRSEIDRLGEPIGLPARVTRAVVTRPLVAAVARQVARVATYDPTIGDYAEGGAVSRVVADALARGRDKSQRGVETMRNKARHVYEQVAAERDDWPDVYSEVAERLGVGRTTAYRYLRDAGVIKTRKGDR